MLIPPEPTVLVAHVGMSFDDVVKRSSFPALANAMPPEGETGFGTIDVTEPAVIIKYDHPQHGFELPPTKFAALTFGHSILESISTSPMLDPLRYPEAAKLLAQLQERFRARGWVPWTGNGSVWFDLSPKGKKALHAELMRYSQAEQWLVVPNQHVGMIFRIKCVDDCDDEDDARFLIDVGIGDEVGD
jgi:hypothetical protein